MSTIEGVTVTSLKDEIILLGKTGDAVGVRIPNIVGT